MGTFDIANVDQWLVDHSRVIDLSYCMELARRDVSMAVGIVTCRFVSVSIPDCSASTIQMEIVDELFIFLQKGDAIWL